MRSQTAQVLKSSCRARTAGGSRSAMAALSTAHSGALQCRQSVNGRAAGARSSR